TARAGTGATRSGDVAALTEQVPCAGELQIAPRTCSVNAATSPLPHSPSPTGEHARQARAAKRATPSRFDLAAAQRTNDRFGLGESGCPVENRSGMRGGAIELGFGETRIAI